MLLVTGLQEDSMNYKEELQRALVIIQEVNHTLDTLYVKHLAASEKSSGQENGP